MENLMFVSIVVVDNLLTLRALAVWIFVCKLPIESLHSGHQTKEAQ